jgi:hypothetical protein
MTQQLQTTLLELATELQDLHNLLAIGCGGAGSNVDIAVATAPDHLVVQAVLKLGDWQRQLHDIRQQLHHSQHVRSQHHQLVQDQRRRVRQCCQHVERITGYKMERTLRVLNDDDAQLPTSTREHITPHTQQLQ